MVYFVNVIDIILV